MELSVRKLVLAIVLAPWIAGCMPDNPQTVFDWNVKDTLPHARVRNDARLYAYRDTAPRVPVPTPRPNRDYVTAKAAPGMKTHMASARFTVMSPVAGTLVSVDVAPGQTLAAAAQLAILEARKMEFPVTLDDGGRLRGGCGGSRRLRRLGQRCGPQSFGVCTYSISLNHFNESFNCSNARNR